MKRRSQAYSAHGPRPKTTKSVRRYFHTNDLDMYKGNRPTSTTTYQRALTAGRRRASPLKSQLTDSRYHLQETEQLKQFNDLMHPDEYQSTKISTVSVKKSLNNRRHLAVKSVKKDEMSAFSMSYNRIQQLKDNSPQQTPMTPLMSPKR